MSIQQFLVNFEASIPQSDYVSLLEIGIQISGGFNSKKILQELTFSENSKTENVSIQICVQYLFSALYLSLNDGVKALEHLRKLEIIIEQLQTNSVEGLTLAKFIQANIHSKRSESLIKLELFTLAASEIFLAEKLFSQLNLLNSAEYAETLIFKAVLMINSCLNLGEASVYLRKAEDILDSNPNSPSTLYAQIIRWRGWQGLMTKNFPLSQELSEKAQEKFAAAGDQINSLRMNLLNAEICFISKNFSHAKEICLTSLQQLHHHHKKHHSDISDFYSILARIYSASNSSIEEVLFIFGQAEIRLRKQFGERLVPKQAKLQLLKAKGFETLNYLEEAYSCVQYAIEVYKCCTGTERSLQVQNATNYLASIEAKIKKNFGSSSQSDQRQTEIMISEFKSLDCRS